MPAPSSASNAPGDAGDLFSQADVGLRRPVADARCARLGGGPRRSSSSTRDETSMSAGDRGGRPRVSRSISLQMDLYRLGTRINGHIEISTKQCAQEAAERQPSFGSKDQTTTSHPTMVTMYPRRPSAATTSMAAKANDTFVYGANEAAPHEYIDGRRTRVRRTAPPTASLILLGDNGLHQGRIPTASSSLPSVEPATRPPFKPRTSNGEQGIETVIGDSHANTLAVRLESTSDGGAPAVHPVRPRLQVRGRRATSSPSRVTKALDTIGRLFPGRRGSRRPSARRTKPARQCLAADTFVFDTSASGEGPSTTSPIFPPQEGRTRSNFAQGGLRQTQGSGELSKGAFSHRQRSPTTGTTAHHLRPRRTVSSAYDDDVQRQGTRRTSSPILDERRREPQSTATSSSCEFDRKRSGRGAAKPCAVP